MTLVCNSSWRQVGQKFKVILRECRRQNSYTFALVRMHSIIKLSKIFNSAKMLKMHIFGR